MELRDLRALLAVLRAGSFTSAARDLGYTQSAVSQQVAALEEELGQRLVHRRPVGPTVAGARLAEHAARVLLRLDVARSELRHLGDEVGPVRVALGPLASAPLLAAALRLLRTGEPTLSVTVRTLDRREAIAELAAGDVDAALVDGFTSPGEPIHLAEGGLVLSTPVAEAAAVVALPEGHPLAGGRTVDLDVLTDAPWIVAPSFAGRELDERFGSPRSARLELLYEGTDLRTLLALVAAALGATVLPAGAWASPGEGVVGVPLRIPRLVHGQSS